DELKLENDKLKETQVKFVKFVKFDKSANSLRELLNNQKSPSCKIGLGFNSDKASTSKTKTMSFVGLSVEKVTDGSTIKVHGSTLPGSSRPNGKLIHNSIINGPYVRRMIPELGDTNRKVPVNGTIHVQTNDELIEKELKKIEADDQSIQTILLGLSEDIYAAPEWSRHVTIVHQTKDLHTADYTQFWFQKSSSMLNKENYVPWSSRILRYAKSRPNGKLIHNSIINGPYVRRVIPELGGTNRKVPVNGTIHVQTDDELIEKELKKIEADDQSIQTILLGLSEDIYAAEKKAKLFNKLEKFTSNEGESIESYYHRFLKLMNNLKRNKHFSEKIASNLKFLNNLQPEWSRHVTIVHQTKDLHTADYTQLYDFLKYNQKENYMQQPMPNPEDITDPTTAMNMIAQPGMNMGQDRQMQMVRGNGENQFRQYVGQNVWNLNGYNAVQNVRNQVAQNPRVQNVGNQNGLIGVPRNANLNGNGNLVAARAEGNPAGHNGNQMRCYNYRGKEKAGIQLQAEEFDLMAAAADLNEIEEVNANCILMANLQQALTSGTQTDKTPVYDSDGLAKVHDYENCDDNEIFNMFTQEEQYTKLLEPIPEPHQIPQNDNSIISEDYSVEQSGGNSRTTSCKF
nr:hypothetical protein [Tanacetum cinerariifolium]